MSSQSPEWRPLVSQDLERVDEIAALVHTELPERTEVFAEKVSLFPSGCWKLCLKREVVGYGISHPWVFLSIPPLDEFLKSLPEKADCLYLHDVVVLPIARGHSAAGSYVELVKAEALRLNIRKLACVSVYGTNVLWSRYGFSVIKNDEIQRKLKSYGGSAKYMCADVAL